tara:strand:+ start:856 stop:1338 length:483 start_codon:yes stop_codon:yes gene_type:complete
MPGKNTKGGKKHKRNKNYASDNKAIRYKEEGQEYAKVLRCKGNCRFDVVCCDGKTRASVLCGGMRKRKFINQGQLVLVSIREWQDDICDIIDSYEESHAKRLKSEKEIPESFNLAEENQYDEDDDIEFITGMPDENEESEEEEVDFGYTKEESVIDVDDI